VKPLNAFFSGAIMTASAVIGLFFLRFWKMSRDRLFLYFGLAFFLMAIERWVLVLSPADGEYRPYVYLVRLVAFLVIAAAIIDKNRRPQKS
jgi:hypothetical protein